MQKKTSADYPSSAESWGGDSPGDYPKSADMAVIRTSPMRPRFATGERTVTKRGRMGLALALAAALSGLSVIIILWLGPSAHWDIHKLSLLDVPPRKERSEHAVVVHSHALESTVRHFIVRRPPGKARFVVLLLHDTHPSTEDRLGHFVAPWFFERVLVNRTHSWRAQGAALIYLAARIEGPNSTRFCWGAGGDYGLCTASHQDKQDESFLIAVLDMLAELHLDGLSVYLMGFSGGGRMVWRAACNSTLAQRISGIFVASGLLPAKLRAKPPLCQIATMPPMVIMHGTQDKIVPIRLAEGKHPYPPVAGPCLYMVLLGCCDD